LLIYGLRREYKPTPAGGLSPTARINGAGPPGPPLLGAGPA